VPATGCCTAPAAADSWNVSELTPVAKEFDPGDSEEAALPDLELLPSAGPDHTPLNPAAGGEHDTAVLHQSIPWRP
jgi:hypothetical protein